MAGEEIELTSNKFSPGPLPALTASSPPVLHVIVLGQYSAKSMIVSTNSKGRLDFSMRKALVERTSSTVGICGVWGVSEAISDSEVRSGLKIVEKVS